MSLNSYYKLILICAIQIVIANLSICQTIESENIFKNEKITVGIGIGVDYSIIGPKLKLKVRENIFITSSISLVQTNIIPTLGIESQYVKLKNTRICPYAFLIIGNDLLIRLKDFDQREIENTLFRSLNLGLGSKFRIFKDSNSYFTAGISYRFYNKNLVEDHIKDFNERRQLNYSANINELLFTIGYNFILK